MVHCSEQAMVPAISDLQKPQDLTDDGKSGKAKGSSGLSDQRVVGSNPAWGASVLGKLSGLSFLFPSEGGAWSRSAFRPGGSNPAWGAIVSPFQAKQRSILISFAYFSILI